METRLTWLNESDQNMAFFHKIDNNRRRQNSIKSLQIGHDTEKNSRRIQDHIDDHCWIHIDDHFKKLLGSREEHQIKLKHSIWEEIANPRDLDREITKEEIKEATKGVSQDKALSLDRFPIFFYKKILETH